MSERVIKPSELTDVQVVIGIRDGRFSKTASTFWDDGSGPLWAYVESLGIVGYVRAGSFETAWECAQDEIMFDGTHEDAIEGLSDQQLHNGELNEGYGYRNSGQPSNPQRTSGIYREDLNGAQLVPVTDAYAEEHGIEITVREDDYCRYCGAQITDAGQGAWVDATDGDGCSGNPETGANENGVHQPAEWSGSQCPIAPADCWVDDATGEHVNARTNQRTPQHDDNADNDGDNQ